MSELIPLEILGEFCPSWARNALAREWSAARRSEMERETRVLREYRAQADGSHGIAAPRRRRRRRIEAAG